MRLSLFNARGEDRTLIPLREKDFKPLSCNGIGPDNPQLYSSATVNSGQQASAKVGPAALYPATYEIPDLYADKAMKWALAPKWFGL